MSNAFIDAVKNDDVQTAKQFAFNALNIKVADSFNAITSNAFSNLGFTKTLSKDLEKSDDTSKDVNQNIASNEDN